MKLPIQSQPVMRYVSTAKMTSSNIQQSGRRPWDDGFDHNCYIDCIEDCKRFSGVGQGACRMLCSLTC